jgi:hypothetical protein
MNLYAHLYKLSSFATFILTLGLRYYTIMQKYVIQHTSLVYFVNIVVVATTFTILHIVINYQSLIVNIFFYDLIIDFLNEFIIFISITVGFFIYIFSSADPFRKNLNYLEFLIFSFIMYFLILLLSNIQIFGIGNNFNSFLVYNKSIISVEVFILIFMVLFWSSLWLENVVVLNISLELLFFLAFIFWNGLILLFNYNFLFVLLY